MGNITGISTAIVSRMHLSKSVPLFLSFDLMVEMIRDEEVNLDEEVSPESLFIFEYSIGEMFDTVLWEAKKKLNCKQAERLEEIIEEAGRVQISYRRDMIEETPQQYAKRVGQYMAMKGYAKKNSQRQQDSFITRVCQESEDEFVAIAKTKQSVVSHLKENYKDIDYSYAKLRA